MYKPQRFLCIQEMGVDDLLILKRAVTFIRLCGGYIKYRKMRHTCILYICILTFHIWYLILVVLKGSKIAHCKTKNEMRLHQNNVKLPSLYLPNW